MTTKGFIQPTAHDSSEQHMRWMLLKMHHYWWYATGVKDVRSINQLTQDIRKEWLETRKKNRPITDRQISDVVRQISDFFDTQLADSDKQALGKLIADWVGKGG